MKQNTVYLGVQKKTYTFDKAEIKSALLMYLEKLNIKPASATEISCFVFGADEDQEPYAELEINYTEEKTKGEKC
jgi:hypothetical protein